VLSGETTNTNFIVFGLTRAELNNTHSLSQEQIACYMGSVGKIINGEEDKQKFSISSFK
jgi:hypothetical protein